MVYKIIGHFDDDNFEKILEKISTLFDFIYIDQSLFVGLRKYQYKEEGDNLLKKVLRPSKNFYIEQIDEKNISRQSDFIKQWCLDKFVLLDTQKFEIQEQERLRQTWKDMDNMEAELQKILKERG